MTCRGVSRRAGSTVPVPGHDPLDGGVAEPGEPGYLLAADSLGKGLQDHLVTSSAQLAEHLKPALNCLHHSIIWG